VEITLPNKQLLFPYRTQEGRLLRRSEVDNHHVFWEKANYKTKKERTFRNMEGLVLPMVITWHSDLHANLRPPQKPSKALMNQIVDYTKELGFEDPYERFRQIAGFVIRLSERHGEVADQAQKIGANLVLQSAFIDKGMVYEN